MSLAQTPQFEINYIATKYYFSVSEVYLNVETKTFQSIKESTVSISL